MARPEFQANPDQFYPTNVFANIGFTRAECACGNFYWRHTEERTTCGDSNCEGKYSFIGNGTGNGNNITFAEAWQGKKLVLIVLFVNNYHMIRHAII